MKCENVCEKCEYWDDAGKWDSELNGITSQCRRRSPRGGDKNRCIFPETRSLEWCGEFKRREVVPDIYVDEDDCFLTVFEYMTKNGCLMTHQVYEKLQNPLLVFKPMEDGSRRYHIGVLDRLFLGIPT